jgi:hypothetical protein
MKGKHLKTGPSLYNEIANRNVAAIIAQLRTGHCGLNRYLHRFNITNSPHCQCGYGKETAERYLLECRKYRDQMKKLRREAGTGKMRMEILLGDPKAIKHTLEYMKEIHEGSMGSTYIPSTVTGNSRDIPPIHIITKQICT